MAIGCALIVALFAGTLVLFETQVMWDMESPNAASWNATLNCSATAGFNVIPIFLIIIGVAAIGGMLATYRGFG